MLTCMTIRSEAKERIPLKSTEAFDKIFEYTEFFEVDEGEYTIKMSWNPFHDFIVTEIDHQTGFSMGNVMTFIECPYTGYLTVEQEECVNCTNIQPTVEKLHCDICEGYCDLKRT